MSKIIFVDEHSIVRKTWRKADTVLFIFEGAAAEFIFVSSSYEKQIWVLEKI